MDTVWVVAARSRVRGRPRRVNDSDGWGGREGEMGGWLGGWAGLGWAAVCKVAAGGRFECRLPFLSWAAAVDRDGATRRVRRWGV